MDFTAFTDSSTSFTELNSIPLGDPGNRETFCDSSSRWGTLHFYSTLTLFILLFIAVELLINIVEFIPSLLRVWKDASGDTSEFWVKSVMCKKIFKMSPKSSGHRQDETICVLPLCSAHTGMLSRSVRVHKDLLTLCHDFLKLQWRRVSPSTDVWAELRSSKESFELLNELGGEKHRVTLTLWDQVEGRSSTAADGGEKSESPLHPVWHL